MCTNVDMLTHWVWQPAACDAQHRFNKSESRHNPHNDPNDDAVAAEVIAVLQGVSGAASAVPEAQGCARAVIGHGTVTAKTT